MSRTQNIRTAAGVLLVSAALGGGLLRLAREPRILAEGDFHQVAHTGTGTAKVYQTSDGTRRLSLLGFRTAYRPDLYVYLITAADASDNETVKRSDALPVGPLQGGEGDQEYVLPDTVDLLRYHAVTVWSCKYEVNFTTAPLAWRPEF